MKSTLKSNRFPALAGALSRTADRLAAKAAHDVEAAAKTAVLTGPKTGRHYTRGGKSHQASAPGEAPATELGALASSLQTEKVGEGHYRVGTAMEYAPVLEFGGAHTAARPFLHPALAEVQPELEKASRQLEDQLRGAAR